MSVQRYKPQKTVVKFKSSQNEILYVRRGLEKDMSGFTSLIKCQLIIAAPVSWSSGLCKTNQHGLNELGWDDF